MADTGNRAYSHWYTLYKAALLELDRDKHPQRITEAVHAVMDRMRVLNGSDCCGSESEALINALIALHDLQKMAESSRGTDCTNRPLRDVPAHPAKRA